MRRTYALLAAVLIGAIAIQIGALWWVHRIQERAVVAAYKPLDDQLDDLNRRACRVYRDFVAQGRMQPDPAFSDCLGAN